MQRSALPAGRIQQNQVRTGPSRRPQPFTSVRPHATTICNAAASLNGNGNGNGVHSKARCSGARCPTPAQTIRTIVDIVNEGTLCTVNASGLPVGIPVTFSTDKQGQLQLHMEREALEMANIQGSTACSLMVQPTCQPARAVAAVTLMGKLDAPADFSATTLPLNVERCFYFGGLDQSSRGLEVSGSDFQAAEPDALRKAAPELVNTWNSECAEDLYRIVSDFLGVPLTEMSYVELLWVDQLGMYLRSEVAGQEGPQVLRVPFYRPVLDERDARAVITMASQIAWERERAYTPPITAMYADAAAAAAAAASNN
ncbi:hypothetical protein Agub_g14796 [Astrephomene gubernaculifera]|uniref:DUF2470 domain-containing protein n=1 Tax=Astrephomene gubernaculifera TaxID=47775 RepID=A0AAD3E3P7_9CHLO|nr:hypothetical protein Agub_g14796 [Astrephomene gubernaculifera]